MRVGYSRISDQQQATSDPLAQAEHELRKAGADLILVEIGSGTDDTARPKFRRLREMVLDGQATEVICPSQDRLGRNLELVLDFVQLCHLQKVPLRDLNGRELEVKTADGRLLTTIIGALDQHRSQLYGEKTRRHLDAAREQGLPARPRLPFGLRKIRNDAGRFVGIEIDPFTGPMARHRVEWFLSGMSMTAIVKRASIEQPDHPLQMRQLRAWLESPMLTGRNCWHKDSNGRFTQVAKEQTFDALISDAEHEAIKVRLSQGTTSQGLRGRAPKMLTGLVKCADCGRGLSHKTTGKSTLYLRCANPACTVHNKCIRADRVFGVLQYSLAEHARTLLPILQRPAVDPPEVATLQREIETLEAIAGTESVVEAKRQEIARLRSTDSTTPGWLLVGALRSTMFWLQEDPELNRQLTQVIDRCLIQLGETVAESMVAEVRCRTAPSLAPLPADQRAIQMPRGLGDLAFAAADQERIDQALAALG